MPWIVAHLTIALIAITGILVAGIELSDIGRLLSELNITLPR